MPPRLPVFAWCTLACALLVACGGGGFTPDPVPPPAVDPFAEVDRLARSTFEQQQLPGMGLAIYDREDRKVFERMYGDFAADREHAVASASKIVAGLVLFRLIDQGYLTLDSTTAAVLGWPGPPGEVTLRHLLSFTSGLAPSPECISAPATTLAACVDQIGTAGLVVPPGTRFEYDSAHLHVAAHMAEVVTGERWNDIVRRQVVEPLGLGSGVKFYTWPRQSTGEANPFIAGGLRASMDDYARLLSVVFHQGTWQGQRLLAAGLFEAQAREPYPDVVIGHSPYTALAYGYRYGLTAWLECDTPAAGCAVISSPGGLGWTPWVDRDGGYYAVLAMEVADAHDGLVNFSVELAQALKPEIRRALAQP